jgi:hypothetical protein
LGVTIVGEHAADLLAEYVLAMKHGIGMNGVLLRFIAIPHLPRRINTRQANGQRHAPKRALGLANRYLAWRRGD